MAGFGVLDAMSYVQKQGEMGRERGQENRLAQLSQLAYGQTGADRQSSLALMEGTTAGAGHAAGAKFRQMDTDSATDLARDAARFVALAEMGDDAATQAAYPQFAAKAASITGYPIPQGAYDPKFLAGIQKLAGASGQGGNVQSTYIDAQGNRVAIMRDGSTQVLGQNAPNNQIIDTGNGFYGVNRSNLSAAPVQVGGAPQMAAPQPHQQRAPGEVPFSIDPSLPPQVQAAIRANESQFANAPDGSNVQIPTQGQPQMGGQPGGVLTKAPDPLRLAADRRAEEAASRAEQANMRAYDAAQNAARGTAPVGFRFRQDGSLEPIPGGPKTAGATPTEGERGAAGYLQRMQAAEAEVTQLAEAGYRPNLRDAYTAGEGALVNWAASDTGQVNRQQQEDWVRAKLRKESGAAIPTEEMSREIKTYFPQIGDSESVIASKARSRQTALKQMEIIAGRAQGGVNAPAAPAGGGTVWKRVNGKLVRGN